MTAAELRVSAEWGDDAGQVPHSPRVQPSFADQDEPFRAAPAPLRIALDPRGGVHALAGRGDAAAVIHFAADGAVAARTPLPLDAGARVDDFAADGHGSVYVVGADHAGDARLRSIAEDGAETWSCVLDAPRDGSAAPPRLLLDGEARLHVALDDGRGTVLQVGEGGTVQRVVHSGAAGNRAFITRDGRLVFETYFAASGRRGIVTVDPRGGSRRERVPTDALQPWLVWPLGVDARSRMYSWHLGELARLAADDAADAGAEPLGRIDSAVAGADGAVFLSRSLSGEALEVVAHRPGRPAETRVLPLPVDGGAWTLAHVDRDGRLYAVREEPGTPPAVAIYGAGGVPEASGGLALLPDQARLQPPDSWRVDAGGGLHLPVVDDAGFRVIRIAFDA